jgi:DNA polymerase elongation subunit (family B)
MFGSCYYNRFRSVIHWSVYDENNKVTVNEEKWVPDFYIPRSNNFEDEGWVSEDGVSLKRVVCKTWKERKQLIKTYKESGNAKTYGSDLSPENKFILERWPGNIDEHVPEIHYAIVDIECESENGFPDASEAKERINLITVYSNHKKKFYTFGLEHPYTPTSDNVEYILCKTEEMLLKKYIKFMEFLTPNILSGWHSSGFDIPYIFNRTMRILDEIDIGFYDKWLNFKERQEQDEGIQEKWAEEHQKRNWVKRLSPFQAVEKRKVRSKNRFTKDMQDSMSYKMNGLTDYDYLQLYQQFSLNQRESYKLDYIAEIELGEKKLEYEGTLKDLYKNDWNKFVEYNIQDVNLLVKMEHKLGYLVQAISLSYKCHCTFEDNFGTVTKMETSVYNFLQRKKIIMGDDNTREERVATSVGGFEGAYVKEPVPGMYEWIIDVDIASLYPSNMRGINISYDTKLFQIKDPRSIWEINDDERLEIEFKDGSTKVKTSKELKNEIRTNKWPVSSANVVFEDKEKKKGVLVEMLDMWYDGRKINKKKMSNFRKKSIEISLKGNDTKFDGSHEVKVIINDSPQLRYLTVEQYTEYQENLRQEKIHFNRQWSDKILLNSLYGAVSTPFFRYYDIELARSVTLSGQTIIKTNGKLVNEFFKKDVFEKKIIRDNFKIDETMVIDDCAIYQDTDSIYISFKQVMDKLGVSSDYKQRIKITRFLAAMIMKELAKFNETFFPETFNAPNIIFWDQELISDRSIFVKRKKYVCHIVEINGNPPKPDEELLKKGLDMVRSSTPKIFRSKLEEAVSIILEHFDKSKFDDFSLKLFDDFDKWSIDKYALPKSCNNLMKYQCEGLNFISGTPGHMRAALAYNHYIKEKNLSSYEPIKESDRFKLIHIHKSYKIPLQTIAFISKLPPEFEIDNDSIDKKKHFELCYIQPMSTILEAIKWEPPNFFRDSEDISDLFR